jgi:hypothetical protein
MDAEDLFGRAFQGREDGKQKGRLSVAGLHPADDKTSLDLGVRRQMGMPPALFAGGIPGHE